MMQLAIDVAKEMLVHKGLWIIIGTCIIWGLYMEWGKNK